MTLLDYLLTGGILAALGLALRSCIRSRKNGNCCGGDCANCSGGCKK